MEVIPCPVVVDFNKGCCIPVDEAEQVSACRALAHRMEAELRAAKSKHLSCGEVLLPCDLLTRICRDILRMAENEPCGLRGCLLYINYEEEELCRRIGCIECDPHAVATFELSLTLKQDVSTWYSHLPQFIKNLAKVSTIVISPGYVLAKKKLYRSYQQ